MSFGNRAGTSPATSRGESSSSPVLEGEVLAGKYKVERVLGAGGMGVVVAARHLQLDQLVALKFVLPSAVEDSQVMERFLREAKAAVRLKSEHVAKVLDVGTLESGAPYIVMEHLDGTNLSAVVEQQSPLSADVACDYIIQACEALSEAHTLGIVHRDLKPQNLFLTKGVGGAPLVKVLDFGISKIKQPEGAHNLTQTATVIGSPLYMAPEQMRSARNADPRSDIWSLGVVLYELLGRTLPFEAETITDLAIKIVQEPFPPLESIRPDLPPELTAAVHKCLEKDPANRFQDAGELASALEPFAPAASRVIADRTRKVISAHSKTLGASVAPALSRGRADASGAVRAVSSPALKSPSSPEAWSETKGKSPAGNNNNKRTTLVGALAAAGLVLVLAFLAFRTFGHAPATAIAPVVTSAPPVSPGPVATAAAAAQPPPVAVAPDAPPASAAAAPAPSTASSVTPAAPTGPRPIATASARAPSPPPAPPKTAPKPKPNSDDIPSLR